MSTGRRNYDRGFKEEAVRLVLSGRSANDVGRDLGVAGSNISRWVLQYKDDPNQSFPGKGYLKADDAERRQMQRENERLRRERDILKKALAIFSKAPQ